MRPLSTSLPGSIAPALLLAGLAHANPPPPNEVSPPMYTPLTVTAGLEAQSFVTDGALGLRLGFEGERWGFDTRYSALAMGSDAARWGDDPDPVQLLNLNLTYAVHTTRRARLRVELGAHAFLARSVSMMGPGVGASMEACLAGPLDIEGRLQLTPFPYRQVDAQGGLALRFGSLALRGGLRALYLDDAGNTDGLRRANTWRGPYAGLSLIF